MSALPHQRTLLGVTGNVRFVPIPDMTRIYTSCVTTNCWSFGSFGSCLVIHRPNCVMLKLTLENLNFAPLVSRLARVEAR